MFAAYSYPHAALDLPGAPVAAEQGDLEPLASLAAMLDDGHAAVPQARYLSMVCSGDGDRYDAEIAAAGLRSEALAEHWFDVLGMGGRDTAQLCELWDVEPSLDPGQLALTDDVPTLLFTGEVDHVTPPVLGEQLDEQLSASHRVEAHGLAHAPVEGLDARADGGGSGILAAFLDDPSSEPDTTGTRRIPPVGALGQFRPRGRPNGTVHLKPNRDLEATAT